MKEVDLEAKFEKIMSVEDLKKLQDIVIYEDSEGNYCLFGTYFIKKTDVGCLVTSTGFDNIHNFSNLKNATSWCIFHKRNKMYKANRLLELDKKLSGTDVEISVLKRKFKKSETLEEKLIYLAKMNENKLKRIAFKNELIAYISESTNWQKRKFEPNPLQ